MTSIFGFKEKSLIEVTLQDAAEFTHTVIRASTKFIVDPLTKHMAIEQINQINKQRTSQRQQALSHNEQDNIRDKYKTLAPRLTNLLTMEIKVLTYNVCTAVLALNVAFIALGITAATSELALSLALIAVIREVYGRATELESNELKDALVQGANWGIKKLNDWFQTGDVNIVIGQKVYGIFRSSAIFTKMMSKKTEVIVAH